MKITKLDELASKENPHGVDARIVYDHDNAVIAHIALASGQALKPHSTPVDVCFFVLEGEGICQIGEEEMTVSANCAVESPANVMHAWRNEANKMFRVLVVKAPKPKK